MKYKQINSRDFHQSILPDINSTWSKGTTLKRLPLAIFLIENNKYFNCNNAKTKKKSWDYSVTQEKKKERAGFKGKRICHHW